MKALILSVGSLFLALMAMSPKHDTEFVKETTATGIMEIKLGELALLKTSSPEVKKLARMLIDDHSKANQELREIAAKKKITLPTEMSKEGEDNYKKLSDKNGKDFDEAYTEMMVKGHRKTVKNFRDIADSGKDPDVKAWAAKKLPTLEHHLAMAEAADSTVRSKK